MKGGLGGRLNRIVCPSRCLISHLLGVHLEEALLAVDHIDDIVEIVHQLESAL